LKNIIFNKRGISPIIATVLLIVFSIITFYGVANWTNKLVKKSAYDVIKYTENDLYCGSVGLNLVCDDTGNAVLRNSGTLTIKKIIIRKDSGNVEELSGPLEPSETYSFDTIDLDFISAIPIVNIEDKEYGCANKGYVFSEEDKTGESCVVVV